MLRSNPLSPYCHWCVITLALLRGLLALLLVLSAGEWWPWWSL